MELNANWTNDCQGKKDYDADLVRLRTRYWPQGGGFGVLDEKGWHQNDERPEIKPSAISHIMLQDEEISTKEFEGETEADVKAQVESWANEQFAKVGKAVRNAF